MLDWEKLLEEDVFEIAGRRFKSRLIIGSGKFKSFQETKEVLEASGAEIITVAVRRVNITDPNKENLLDYIDPKKYLILPNTAGCYTAEDAIKQPAHIGCSSTSSLNCPSCWTSTCLPNCPYLTRST